MFSLPARGSQPPATLNSLNPPQTDTQADAHILIHRVAQYSSVMNSTSLTNPSSCSTASTTQLPSLNTLRGISAFCEWFIGHNAFWAENMFCFCLDTWIGSACCLIQKHTNRHREATDLIHLFLLSSFVLLYFHKTAAIHFNVTSCVTLATSCHCWC